MAKLISISSQKGGVGKTTFTMLLATYLHNTGFRVGIIDADYPQHSLVKIRKQELLQLESSGDIKQAFEEKGLTPLEVVSGKVSDVARLVGKLRADTQKDLWFIDLPGTLNIEGIVEVAAALDSIIIPTEMDKKTFTSTFETFAFYRRNGNPNQQVGMFWNRMKHRENRSTKDVANKMAQEKYGITLIKQELGDLVGIKRSSSTLFPSEEAAFIEFVGELQRVGFLAELVHG